MVRLNVPGAFIYGGAALPGRLAGRELTILDAIEGMGRVQTGDHGRSVARPHRAQLPADGGRPAPASSPPTPWPWWARRSAWRRSARPCCRRCTASGALWRSAPASGSMPPAGRGGPLPRDLVTRQGLENACAVVAATGGSTNAALHLPAIAHEAGIALHLDDVAEVFARTPLIVDLSPGGTTWRATCTTSVACRRDPAATLLDGGFCTARPHAGRLHAARSAGRRADVDGEVVRRCDEALHREWRRRGAQGQPGARRCAAEDRRAERPALRGPARVFEGEEEAMRAVSARAYRAGDVLVIRNEGPRGGPGMREMLRHHRRDLRAGHGRAGGAADRRPLLRRDARPVHRLRRPGGRRWAGRSRCCATATASRSTPGPARSTWPWTRPNWRLAARRGSRASRPAWPVCCRSTRGWSGRRTSVPSRTPGPASGRWRPINARCRRRPPGAATR